MKEEMKAELAERGVELLDKIQRGLEQGLGYMPVLAQKYINYGIIGNSAVLITVVIVMSVIGRFLWRYRARVANYLNSADGVIPSVILFFFTLSAIFAGVKAAHNLIMLLTIPEVWLIKEIISLGK